MMHLRPRLKSLTNMQWNLPPRNVVKTVSDLVGVVYVISLPWRKERLNQLFKDYGDVLGEVKVVNGRAILNPLEPNQLHQRFRTPLTPKENQFLSGNPDSPGWIGYSGHTGCALAHADAWRKSKGQKNQELVMILEDDVAFPSPNTLVTDLWNCMKAWQVLSENKSGILFLNGGMGDAKIHAEMVRPMSSHQTMECYIISSGFRDALLNEWQQSGMNNSIDLAIWDFLKAHCPLNGFTTRLKLAGQRTGLESDISQQTLKRRHSKGNTTQKTISPRTPKKTKTRKTPKKTKTGRTPKRAKNRGRI